MNEQIKELEGLAADINMTEILFHIGDGTLRQWLESWQMQMAYTLESMKQSKSD